MNMKLFLGAVIVALGLSAVFASRDLIGRPGDSISENRRPILDFSQANLESGPTVRQMEKPSPSLDLTFDELSANQTVPPVYSVAAADTFLSQTNVVDDARIQETATSAAGEPAPIATDATSIETDATSSQTTDGILSPALGAQTREICWSIINGKVFNTAASGWTTQRTFATRQKQFFNLQCKTQGTNELTRHVRRLLFR